MNIKNIFLTRTFLVDPVGWRQTNIFLSLAWYDKNEEERSKLGKKPSMYMKCLNNDKREELGWKTSFQVYYGRENNETLRASLPINEEIDISRVKSVKKRDYNYFVKKTIKIRRKALEASKPIDQRTIK